MGNTKKNYVPATFVNSFRLGSGKVKIGIDIVDVERFISFLNEHKNARSDKKVFLAVWEKQEHDKYGSHEIRLDTKRMEYIGGSSQDGLQQKGATKFTDDSEDLPF